MLFRSDSLGKTYSTDASRTEIARPHAALMVRAAKCTFAILKEMRQGLSVPPALNDEVEQVRSAFGAMTDVFRRDPMNQASVDDLLSKKAG